MAHDKRNNGPSDSPGVLGQMSRLRAHSGASAAELRAFVQQLRGRGPQEVIGVLAQSNLIRATALAAAGTAILLLAFTILPALVAGKRPAPVAPAAVNADAKPAVADAKDNAANSKEPDKAAAKTKDADVADKLGIGDAKTADPGSNPLEAIGDDLFKDVK